MSFKHMISVKDYTKEELFEIFKVSKEIKDKMKKGEKFTPLEGKTLAMIFQKPSTRTRVSFEAGIYQLGGIGLYLNASDLQIGRGETVYDTAKTLGRYIDGIMIRTFSHKDVLDLAEYSGVPVINGLTNLLHPCQILGDLLTAMEHLNFDFTAPDFSKLKAAFVGDGNNVANSWCYAAGVLGFKFTLCPPSGYECDKEVWEESVKLAAKSGGVLEIVRDPKEAVKDADVIYTDVWASMGQEKETEDRMKAFKPYQVNSELLKLAKNDVKIMHCLPAKRGQEITDEVIDGPNSVVFDEAENRLHIQKGIMYLLMK